MACTYIHIEIYTDTHIRTLYVYCKNSNHNMCYKKCFLHKATAQIGKKNGRLGVIALQEFCVYESANYLCMQIFILTSEVLNFFFYIFWNYFKILYYLKTNKQNMFKVPEKIAFGLTHMIF